MRPTLVSIVVAAVTVVVAVVAFDAGVGQSVVAALVAGVILRVGWSIIAGLAQPVPEPPDPGELRKVKLNYRCAICGAEVRMTVAAAEDPEPPRHCLEDMELVTPIE